ncbi:hypothetical protein J1614_012045 [Plenodomus biglobosus]|nr:hypothetical protein J1614_012045 [Plenodomus biglobosus]
MAKRQKGGDGYDPIVTTAVQLYKHKPLSEVQRDMARNGVRKTYVSIMTSQAQLTPKSKSQWESTFSRQKVRKNVKKSEWAYIASKLRDREAEGKKSVVELNGQVIPDSKIKKQSRVQTFQPTFDRFLNCARPSTPPDISIRTPTPLSSPASPMATPRDDSDFQTEPIHLVFSTIEYSASSIYLTPLRDFIDWFDYHISGVPFEEFPQIFLPPRPSSSDSQGLECLAKNQDAQLLQPTTQAGQQKAVSLYSPSTSVNRYSQMFHDYDKYLPALAHEDLALHGTRHYLIDTGKSHWDTLKKIIGLRSNNFRDEEKTFFTHELALTGPGLEILRRILRQKCYTIASFAEDLFLIAVREENYKLLDILIDHGVNINIRVFHDRTGLPTTALQFAIERRKETLIKHLLAKMLSYCQATGSSNKSLRNETSGILLKLKIPIKLLRLAVYDCSLDIIDLLLEACPTVLENARSRPWILLEAAATRKDGLDIFLALVARGLDIHAVDKQHRGSALAVACASGNHALVNWLLSAKVNVSREVWSPWRNLEGKSALHAAVLHRHEELVRLLLHHGANPNQNCGCYPIQCAASHAHPSILNILIQSGAVVDQCVSASSETTFWGFNRTAIRIAFHDKHIEIVDTLYQAGAVLQGTLTSDEDAKIQGIAGRISFLLRDTRMICTLWGLSLVQVRDDIDSLDFMKDVILRGCIDGPMTSDDIALGILCHGTVAMENLIHDDLFSQIKTKISPALLYATVTKASEALVEDTFQAMISKIGRREAIRLYGPRALVAAVERGDRAIVRLLLSFGLSPFEAEPHMKLNSVEMWHRDLIKSPCPTAFYFAVKAEKLALIDIFLDWHHRSTYLQGKFARERLICGAYLYTRYGRAQTTEAIQDLLGQEFAEESIVYRFFSSEDVQEFLAIALHANIKAGYFDEALWILERTYDPNVVNMNTPIIDWVSEHTNLQIAARENEALLVGRLVEKGADVNAPARPYRGATALQYAAMNGNFEIVRFLCKAGADINAAAGWYDGRTAIEGAAEWGRLDMVWYLLEAGADIKGQSNKNYRRTVCRACRRGHETIARMLQHWKKKKFGEHDCADINYILDTMTNAELDFTSNIDDELDYTDSDEE